ncbi:hypothetical protein OPFLODJI_01664 [Aeromonas hydrophila]
MMALRGVVKKLVAPMSYLRIFHSEKIWFDYFLPLFLAVVCTAGYAFMPKEGANKSYGTRAFTGNPLILND